MRGQINSKIQEKLRQDDFEQINKYILEICERVVKDFTLRNRRFPNNENQIRSILLEEYLDDDEIRKDFDMLDYSFTPEVPENYDDKGNYIGRADIRIKLKTDFERRNAYYIIECKRVNGTSELNKKYVKDGVARFITKKYSAYYGRNIMLGFVVKKLNISDNAKEIESIQNFWDDEYMHGSFKFVSNKDKHERYSCKYHIESGELELSHIFAEFSDIME